MDLCFTPALNLTFSPERRDSNRMFPIVRPTVWQIPCASATMTGVLAVAITSKRFLCLSASQAFVNIVPMPAGFDAVFAREKELGATQKRR
jgi:hypothetical protein